VPNRDGPKAETELERLRREVAAEEKKWVEAQMDPRGVSIDMFNMNCRVLTMVRLLLDKGVVEEEEFNTRYMRVVLEEMRGIREKLQPQLEEARRKAEILSPQGGIVLPGDFGKKQ